MSSGKLDRIVELRDRLNMTDDDINRILSELSINGSLSTINDTDAQDLIVYLGQLLYK